MFISSYTTIFFFVKIFFFGCLYFSKYDIRMFLFVFWLRGRPFNKYLRNWGNEVSHPKCVQVRKGERSITPHVYVRTYIMYLFSCFCLMVSCFICRNLTVPSFKKGVFVRNGYFSPIRSISVVMR